MWNKELLELLIKQKIKQPFDCYKIREAYEHKNMIAWS